MSLPLFVYPISYTLIDTFLVVFIKATSVNGHTAYNSITINAITEFIKLCIAVYVAHSEGSLHTLNAIVTNPGLLIRFLIPNLMYAVNNNLFHYSVGALPPAVFVVSINAFRTIITAILQPFVSQKWLTGRQVIACLLLVFSFVFASLPEVIKAAFNGAVKGSVFELLVYLSSIYSLISVAASLAQEKLLKDSKSLMVANIINYSIGLGLQIFAMVYAKYTNPEESLFRGLEVFWIKAIPFLMAIVGLSISYVLRYYDNIVKLLCSSVSVLLVNSITSGLAGESFFNAFFFIGWLLTIPASWLYYAQASNTTDSKLPTTPLPSHMKESRSDKALSKHTEEEDSYFKDDDEEAVVSDAKPLLQKDDSNEKKEKEHKSNSRDRTVGLIAFGMLLMFSVMTSTFEVEIIEESVGRKHEVENTCPIYEVPLTDVHSNLRVVDTYYAKYTDQYAVVDSVTGDVYVSCAGKLEFLAPDTAESRKIASYNDWTVVDTSKLVAVDVQQTSTFSPIDNSFKKLPWSLVEELGGKTVPYFWLWCEHHKDHNLVIRPPSPSFVLPRKPLLQIDQQEIETYIQHLSIPTSHGDKPVFDTVLVLYLDAVSRIKFHQFYKRTMDLLRDMKEKNNSGHTVIEMERFHSTGINSEKNYLPLFSGVHAFDTKRYYLKDRKTDVVPPVVNISSIQMREPWLFDIAEKMNFETMSGTSECHHYCHEDCYEGFTHNQAYEVGGFYKQYMNETRDRFPGKFSFPSSTYCEALYRPQLGAKGRSSSKHLPFDPEDWIGNKFAMSYAFDWWRTWLTSHSSAAPKKPRFAGFIFEETHQQDFYEQYDIELSKFIADLTSYATRGRYGTENVALVIMADHGLHFMPEFKVPTGKIANKQPFGYLILPKNYLDTHRAESHNLYHNAKALLTPFDVRATVQYWITGRDWSADKILESVDCHHGKGGKNCAHHHNNNNNNNNIKNQQEIVIRKQLLDKVYSSNHGINMMTSKVPYNRTCEMAGIPRDFCGCGLAPCDGSIKSLIPKIIPKVVEHINSKISMALTPYNDKTLLHVCKPLHPSEIILIPGLDDCLGNDDVIVINAFIQRQMRLISVTFLREQGKIHKLQVFNVNTITPYGKIWKQCFNRFASLNVTHNILEEHHQFCYCVDTPSWKSEFAGWFNAFNTASL